GLGRSSSAEALSVLDVFASSGLRIAASIHLDTLHCASNLHREINGLLLAQAGSHGVILLWLEALCLNFDRVIPWLELWEVEPARFVGLRRPLQTSFFVGNCHRRSRHSRSARVGNNSNDGASSFTLGGNDFGQEKLKQCDKDE